MKETTPPGDPGARYHVPSHIRHAAVDDRVIILDIRSESYFALDPVASLMWSELTLGHGRGEEIPGSPSEIEDDLEEFTRKCLARGLLTQSPEEPAMHQAPRPPGRARCLPALRAWWSLVTTKLALSRKGFCVTYNRALSMARPEEAGGDDTAGEPLDRALEAFARAENFFHLKKAPLDCLPRSLALFRFLRSAGLPAHHCIGVRPFPFTAHAWTECCGRVVHDDGMNRNRFTVIARIPR